MAFRCDSELPSRPIAPAISDRGRFIFSALRRAEKNDTPTDFRQLAPKGFRPAQKIFLSASRPQNAQASKCSSAASAKSSISSTADGQFNPPSSSSRAIARLISGELIGHSRTGRNSCEPNRKYPSANLRRGSAHLKPRAVAVVPRRRSMQPNLGLQFDFRNPLQRLAQNLRFELQLALVRNVLIMAAAALLEVWAARLDAIGRCFDQLRDGAAREPRLLLPDLGLNLFPGQHERHEHRHAAAVGAGGRCARARHRRRLVFRWREARFECSACAPRVSAYKTNSAAARRSCSSSRLCTYCLCSCSTCAAVILRR